MHHVVSGTHKGQKRASDSLELQLQMLVSLHVGTGNRTWVPTEALSTLNCWAISLAPATSLKAFNPIVYVYIQRKKNKKIHSS